MQRTCPLEFQVQEADRGRRGDRRSKPGQVPQGAAAVGGGRGAHAERGEPHGPAEARARRLPHGECHSDSRLSGRQAGCDCEQAR